MKRLYFAISVVLLFALSQCCFAWTPRTINLDTEPDQWQKTLIIVANVPQAEKNTTVRTVKIERILYGPWGKAGEETPVDFIGDYATLAAGEYLLILEIQGTRLLIGGRPTILGPIMDIYQVKTPLDQEVSDIQLIVDTAAIAIPGLKWQRLQELRLQYPNRPLVTQYMMLGKKDNIEKCTEDYVNTLEGSLYDNDHKKFGYASLVLADQLLTALPEDGKVWSHSNKRKELFEEMDRNLPIDDKNREYVTKVIESFQ